MNITPSPLDSSSQTRTALATTLGLLSILAEELARTRAVDADRVIERFDRFAQSASVAAGTAPGEAQYVAQLVEMVKGGLVAGVKERSDDQRG